MKFKYILLLVLVLITVFVGGYSDVEKSVDMNVIIRANDDPNNFHFVIMGDRTGKEQVGVFSDIITKVNLMEPAFVLSVGNSIQGYTEDVNIINDEWDEFDEIISYLKIPFFKIAGNHDVSNQTMVGIYKQRYGRLYYHFTYRNVLFLFMDTDDPSAAIDSEVEKELDKEYKKLKDMISTQGNTQETMDFLKQYEEKRRNMAGGKISDEQYDYFKEVLEENTDVRWTFVLVHKPLWKQSSPPETWIKIEQLLSNRNYTVIAGHEHRHQYEIRNNRDYITMGTCGGGWIWPKTMPGVYHHILWVTMNDTEPVITNILTDGIMEKTDIRACKNIGPLWNKEFWHETSMQH